MSMPNSSRLTVIFDLPRLFFLVVIAPPRLNKARFVSTPINQFIRVIATPTSQCDRAMPLSKMPCRGLGGASPTHPSGTQSTVCVKTLPSPAICASRNLRVIGEYHKTGLVDLHPRWCRQVLVARSFTTPQCYRCILHASQPRRL